jgi:hypothetical protein
MIVTFKMVDNNNNHRTLAAAAIALAVYGLSCVHPPHRCHAFQGGPTSRRLASSSSSSSLSPTTSGTLLPSGSSFSSPFQTQLQRRGQPSPPIGGAVRALQMSSTARRAPGTAVLDTPWEELGFEFRPTNSHVRLQYKDGEWTQKPELVKVGCHVCVMSCGACGVCIRHV